METRTRLVLLAILLVAALLGATALLNEETFVLPPVTPSPAAAPSADGVAAGIEERDAVVILEVPREPVLESADGVESAPEERAAARVDLRRIDAATAWLRRTLPDRYAALTPEEALLIEGLELHGAEVTDADLEHLRHLPNLKDLNLRGTAITDAGMFHLASLNLASLELRGTSLTGVALNQIPSAGLERLHLTDTQVSGNDLALLPPMANLQVLKLNRLEVDDVHLDRLASYPLLRHVELDNTGITDSGLRTLLQRNPNVARLELRGTAVTEDAVKELGAEYPDCEFVFGNDIQFAVRRR